MEMRNEGEIGAKDCVFIVKIERSSKGVGKRSLRLADENFHNYHNARGPRHALTAQRYFSRGHRPRCKHHKTHFALQGRSNPPIFANFCV